MAEAPSFFASVYALVAQIPPGFVASYGQLARMLGAPRAARQVGWAMRCCPDELPWQRVIREDGTIAGSTERVLTAMTECAAFSADDSHDNDDILDTWMDAIDDNLISGPQPMVIDPNQLRRI